MQPSVSNNFFIIIFKMKKENCIGIYSDICECVCCFHIIKMMQLSVFSNFYTITIMKNKGCIYLSSRVAYIFINLRRAMRITFWDHIRRTNT